MLSRYRLFISVAFLLLFAAGLVQGQTGNKPPKVIAAQKSVKVQFHVAMMDEAMIEDREALQERIAMANEIYKGTRLHFELGEVLPLPEGVFDLVSRADRNGLAEKVPAPDKVIQVFVVHSARDVDKINGWIAGVHWRYAGGQKAQNKRRFIILSSIHSDRETLAHELGHWFGLSHEKDITNLMNGSGSRSDTLLTKTQIEIVNDNWNAAIKRKEVKVAE